MIARDAYKYSRNALLTAGASEPDVKAKVIVSHVLGTGYAEVFSDIAVSEDAFRLIESITGRCASGEPVEYATGKAYFRYLTLGVTPEVLIPRKETELVAEKAISLICEKSYQTALDLCTGSGCIAIALAAETDIKVTATDISEGALKTAERNAEMNKASYIRFIDSDMFERIDGTYDIIVSNPPYVSEDEYAGLADGVRLYEPKAALLAGDGLKFYRIIAAESIKHINPGGALVLEIGAGQLESVTALLNSGGFKRIQSSRDYEGRDRIVFAFKEQ